MLKLDDNEESLFKTRAEDGQYYIQEGYRQTPTSEQENLYYDSFPGNALDVDRRWTPSVSGSAHIVVSGGVATLSTSTTNGSIARIDSKIGRIGNKYDTISIRGYIQFLQTAEDSSEWKFGIKNDDGSRYVEFTNRFQNPDGITRYWMNYCNSVGESGVGYFNAFNGNYRQWRVDINISNGDIGIYLDGINLGTELGAYDFQDEEMFIYLEVKSTVANDQKAIISWSNFIGN